MQISAYGHEMPFLSFIKKSILRIFCKHENAKFHAATGAMTRDSCNVQVGVTFVCPDCYRSWAGDVVAGRG